MTLQINAGNTEAIKITQKRSETAKETRFIAVFNEKWIKTTK